MFLETSALTGENVEEAFLKCSRTILGKIETGKTETGLLWCFLLITLFFRKLHLTTFNFGGNSFVIRGIFSLLQSIKV